jgi:hypothetical protein
MLLLANGRGAWVYPKKTLPLSLPSAPDILLEFGQATPRV